MLSFLLGIAAVIAMFLGLGAYFHSIRDDGRPGWRQVGDWNGGRIPANWPGRATLVCDHVPFGLGEEISGFIETRNRAALRNGVVIVATTGGPDGEDDHRVVWADHAFVPPERLEVRSDVVRIPVMIPLPESGTPTHHEIPWNLRASAGPIITGFRAAFEVPVAEANVLRLRNREAPPVPRCEFVPVLGKPYPAIAVFTIAAAVGITLAIFVTESPAAIRWFFAAVSIGMLFHAANMAVESSTVGVRDGFVLIDRRMLLGHSIRTLSVKSIHKVEIDSFDDFGSPHWAVRLTLENGKSVLAARYINQRRLADDLATSIKDAIHSRASSLTT